MAAFLAVLISALAAQTTDRPRQRLGVPQDWSHRQVIFPRSALWSRPDLARLEPRVVHQWLRQATAGRVSGDASLRQETTTTNSFHRDWSVLTGNPGRIAAGMSPAKYSFDVNAPPDCVNDYVVFGMNAPGTGTQGNLIAFNQLYSGAGGLCNGAGPSLLFSYNIGPGRIATSPILSLSGTKIAFVESAATSSIFHVLTWATGPGNGTSPTAPAVPGTGNTASMTSITYAASNNTRSSPWIDYANDTVYVGANNGNVYKITGVFNGTPTLVSGGGWPVAASAGRIISGPVLDLVTHNIFVGDTAGRLRSFNSVTPGAITSLAVGLQGATNPGIIDSPMLDGVNGVVYAVSSNDGVSAVLVEASASTLQQITRARIGLGGSGGAGGVVLYDGAFDNNYFSNPSTGSFLVCGTGPADTSPWLYTFNFTGTTLNTLPTTLVPIVTATNSLCSPITEFFNPNVNGGTDFFYFGITINCSGAGTLGCIMARQNPGAPPVPVNQSGGTSAIVVDNYSTAGQASSIYFTDLSSPGRAVKLTQNGLN
ncbi:MAG TPA: hypothetical protein VGF08_02290 [Terriglobales bacterium]